MDLTNLVGFHGTNGSSGRNSTEGMGARGKESFQTGGEGAAQRKEKQSHGTPAECLQVDVS